MGLCFSEQEVLEDEDETWYWSAHESEAEIAAAANRGGMDEDKDGSGLDNLQPRRKIPSDEEFPKQKHLECFLEMIRNTPEMQIPGVPLAVTMSLYGKVVEIILQTFYDTFRDQVCNTNIFGHTLSLDIEEGLEGLEGSALKLFARADIDEKAIGDLVDVLLKQQEVNCSWLLDGIERRLYINVISLVFGTMSTLLSAFKFNIAGMQLKSTFEKSGMGYIEKLALEGFESVIDQKVLDDYIESHMHEDKASENWIPDTLEHGIMKSVFTLVLYIMKDMVAGMMVDILGDRFSIRLRPCTDEEARMAAEKKAIKKEVQDRKDAVLTAAANSSSSGDLNVSDVRMPEEGGKAAWNTGARIRKISAHV